MNAPGSYQCSMALSFKIKNSIDFDQIDTIIFALQRQPSYNTVRHPDLFSNLV